MCAGELRTWHAFLTQSYQCWKSAEIRMKVATNPQRTDNNTGLPSPRGQCLGLLVAWGQCTSTTTIFCSCQWRCTLRELIHDEQTYSFRCFSGFSRIKKAANGILYDFKNNNKILASLASAYSLLSIALNIGISSCFLLCSFRRDDALVREVNWWSGSLLLSCIKMINKRFKLTASKLYLGTSSD